MASYIAQNLAQVKDSLRTAMAEVGREAPCTLLAAVKYAVDGEIEALLDKIGAPKTASDIGLSEDIIPLTFRATKDIRDKYVLSRLAFDLGVEEILLEAVK